MRLTVHVHCLVNDAELPPVVRVFAVDELQHRNGPLSAKDAGHQNQRTVQQNGACAPMRVAAWLT